MEGQQVIKGRVRKMQGIKHQPIEANREDYRRKLRECAKNDKKIKGRK